MWHLKLDGTEEDFLWQSNDNHSETMNSCNEWVPYHIDENDPNNILKILYTSYLLYNSTVIL